MSLKLVHYMPLQTRLKAERSDNQELKDFCEFFKLVNINASLIDRTGTIKTPLNTHVLWPIPETTDQPLSFAEATDQRAAQILREDKPIIFMYSGGLDSTCILIAMTRMIQQGHGSFDQVTIATSQDAIAENPDAWHKMVLPNYKLAQSRNVLENINLTNERWVQGENADQLFGSDIILNNPEFLTQAYSEDNLIAWMNKKKVSDGLLDKFLASFTELAGKCPIPVTTMRDFMWWFNFTCKWQNVSLRALMFSNAFATPGYVTPLQLANYETFYNTKAFQQLAMSQNLRRWGEPASVYNYKQDARLYILDNTDWYKYANQKVKVGSLYNVLRQREYKRDAIYLHENGNLYSMNLDV